MVNCRKVGHEGAVIDQVQIADLENAAYLPKGRCIKGMLAGNDNWRSPGGHFKGELNKPTDVYSFGGVVSGLVTDSGSCLIHLVGMRLVVAVGCQGYCQARTGSCLFLASPHFGFPGPRGTILI